MPYKFQTLKIRLPKPYDRRRKLTEEDRARMRKLYADGTPVRTIALLFSKKCCRRMVQFVIFPERMQKCAEDFKVRRKDGRYYNSAANTIAARDTRRYKQSLVEKGVLKI